MDPVYERLFQTLLGSIAVALPISVVLSVAIALLVSWAARAAGARREGALQVATVNSEYSLTGGSREHHAFVDLDRPLGGSRVCVGRRPLVR